MALPVRLPLVAHVGSVFRGRGTRIRMGRRPPLRPTDADPVRWYCTGRPTVPSSRQPAIRASRLPIRTPGVSMVESHAPPHPSYSVTVT